jgi:hypothetical protein
MRRNSRNVWAGILAVALCGVSASGCRSGGLETSTKLAEAQSDLLRQAAARADVVIEEREIAHFNQAGATLSTAPVRGLENVPATELPGGIDLAFAYLDSPGQEFPAGFYRLRAVANVREVGTTPGRIDVVAADGRLAGTLPATFEVSSMRVPNVDFPRTTVIRRYPCSGSTPGKCDHTAEICYCCTNGIVTCTPRLFPLLSEITR